MSRALSAGGSSQATDDGEPSHIGVKNGAYDDFDGVKREDSTDTIIKEKQKDAQRIVGLVYQKISLSFNYRKSLRKTDLFSGKLVVDSEVFGLLGSLKKTCPEILTNTQRRPFGS